MRRILLVLAVAAMMAMMVLATTVPVLALSPQGSVNGQKGLSTACTHHPLNWCF